MRKILFPAVLVAALALSALSCTREEPAAPEGPELTCIDAPGIVRATLDDGAGTKTDFQMNAAGTFGKILWTSGDKFQMFGLLDNGNYYKTDYTTSVSTPSASATFTASKTIPSTVDKCYSLHPYFSYTVPVSMNIGEPNPVLGFCISLPAAQQATAGKPDPATHRSYAWSTQPTQDVKFKNTCALVKFRLSGAAVSDLASITLQTNSHLAGDACITHLDQDEPKVWQLSGSFHEKASTSVTLNGPFQRDTDYYIATYPQQLSGGMNLIFKDKDSQTSSKSTFSSVSLRRSRILDLGLLAVTAPGDDPDVVVWNKGHAGKTPTLCILAEGFTAAQQNMFTTLASSAMQKFFDTEPYKSYKDYFNVYFIKAVSKQSGASETDGNGNITKKVDTFFNTRWGTDSYGDMMCDEAKVKSYVSAKCPAILSGNNQLQDVTVILLVNDPRYGGRCINYSDGFAIAMVPYTYNGETMKWSYADTEAFSVNATYPNSRIVTTVEKNEMGISTGDWRNTLLHEGGGHGFGRMMDEYWYGSSTAPSSEFSPHSWPVPYGLNITGDISSTSTTYFWKKFINNSTLMGIDSRYGRIGTFQGGGVYMFGAWRSEKISCMNDNRQYFSFWQRVLIVKRIKDIAGEEFKDDDFLVRDVTLDPVRDGASNAPALRSGHREDLDNIPLMPPLPPPLLIDTRL